MKHTSTVGKSNRVALCLLILGLSTIVFPLYMTVVIAFKQPSEMTTSISGILSLPKTWSLDNFREAMEVTDFWHSLKNSLVISVITVGLSILIHSLMGYALGRNKAHSKFYNFVYLFIVSGMFVPFAILMMPLAKQTAELGLANWFGVIVLYVVFYMPMNVLLYSGYLVNIPMALEEAAKVDGANRFQQMLHITLPGLMPTIMILFILRMGNILNVGYEKVLLLYNPSTYEVADVISTYTYRLSFPASGTPMYSKSTAIGLFNTLVNVVFLLITNAISRKSTESSLF